MSELDGHGVLKDFKFAESSPLQILDALSFFSLESSLANCFKNPQLGRMFLLSKVYAKASLEVIPFQIIK
jgi:hypothetical protein